MNQLSRVIVCLSIICLISASAAAQQTRDAIEILKPKDYQPIAVKASPSLQAILDQALEQTIKSYPEETFKTGDVAATIIDLTDLKAFPSADVRGEQRYYSASVVKMYYMAALERQLQEGKITLTKELQRALNDMIVDSSNDATQYILDVLTDTSNGPDLTPEEFTPWQYKRNRVNRFYSSMGYKNINVNQKTFCEDAYGRERQSRNFPVNAANRNMLTTNATSRLLAEIVLGRMANAERTKRMMDLLKREPFAETNDPDDQAHAFSGKALIDKKLTGARLWSKAGWVTRERHDTAYIETPDGRKFVITVFTQNHGSDKAIIPAIVGRVIDGLSAAK